jgi:hypothetical protein
VGAFCFEKEGKNITSLVKQERCKISQGNAEVGDMFMKSFG